MKYKDTLFYRFMHGFFTTGLHSYYRKVSVTGAEQLPKDAPVIFYANHHNSLIDPCVIAVTSPKSKHFLARSDVFKKGFIDNTLRSVNMLPIYRDLDGEGYQAKNIAIFEECVNILNANRQVLIFPEGSHNKNRKLRPLKGGFLKIAFDFIKKHNREVYVAPVGLVYSTTEDVRGELQVHYGKPVKLTPQDVGEDLLDSFTGKLSSLIHDYPSNESIPVLDYYLFDSGFVAKGASLPTKFEKREQLITRFNQTIGKDEALVNKLKTQADLVYAVAKKENLSISVLSGKEKVTVLDYVLLVLGFPVFVYGVFNNFIPFKFPYLITKGLSDKQFKSPIDLLVGTFSFFLFWTIQTIVVWQFIGIYALVYLASLPITALLANGYRLLFKKVKTAWFKNKNNTVEEGIGILNREFEKMRR